MMVIMLESGNFVQMNQIHNPVLCGEGALTTVPVYFVAPSNEQQEQIPVTQQPFFLSLFSLC